MSDDVYAIRTTYQDVAELGQGYLERADGERILLPLPVEAEPGEGVRFIVYLTDGTPAFAGAGRAVQVSDQGTEVDAEVRFETLVDALVFDERSRPVYDYIVAVRQMAYADLGAAAEAEAEHGEEEVMESDEPSAYTQAALPADPHAADEGQAAYEAHEAHEAYEAQEPQAAEASEAAVEGDVGESALSEPDTFSDAMANRHAPAAYADAEPEPAQELEPAETTERFDVAEEQDPQELTSSSTVSMPPVPLPTGNLRRPAIAAQWAIAAPRRPSPTPGSGLFRYPLGSLPVPSRPPRPELDPSQRVQRAAAPPAH
jgi:hypothetical protein